MFANTRITTDKTQFGLTLIKLTIVIAFGAFIVGFAAAGYQSMMQQKRLLQGESLLVDLRQRQQAFFSKKRSYTMDLNALGYNPATARSQSEVFYTASAQACVDQQIVHCVTIVAQPLRDQDPKLSMSTKSDQILVLELGL